MKTLQNIQFMAQMFKSMRLIPWHVLHTHYLPRFLIRLLRQINPAWTSLLVFSGYYLIPLILCVLHDIQFSNIGKLEVRFIPQATESYLGDGVHLTYSVIVSLSMFPLHSIMASVGISVRHTRSRLEQNGQNWEAIYLRYRGLAFKWYWILIAAICSISTLIILILRTDDPKYASWWGNENSGYAGYYFAIVASQMVFWGLLAFILIASFSLAISAVGRFILRFDPLNPDDCCRMRPLGFVILNMWMFSLGMASAVYLVFKQGYLGLEKNIAIWAVAIIASIIIPLIAASPVWFTSAAIERSRDRYIEQFSKAVPKPSTASIGQFSEGLSAIQNMAGYSTLPFKRRALTFLASLNALQIVSSFRELVFP